MQWLKEQAKKQKATAIGTVAGNKMKKIKGQLADASTKTWKSKKNKNGEAIERQGK